jgi:dUTP pyrophosphatase
MVLCVQLAQLEHGKGLPLPQASTMESAGLDLLAALEEPVTLQPGERYLIPCGFTMALPSGFEAQIRPRSGLALHYGLTVLNAPGTIDADYRGEIKVLLINLGHEPFIVERGMRIAQMVISRFEQVVWQPVQQLEPTISERGEDGFGSTGIYGT